MNPAEVVASFGKWPTAAQRRTEIGCMVSAGAFFGLIVVGAWVALFHGHWVAALWAFLPPVIVLVARYLPTSAARCDGAVVEAYRRRPIALADVTSFLPARWGAPVVTLRSATERPMRFAVTRQTEPFIAALRGLLPAGVDELPTDPAWFRRKRRLAIAWSVFFQAGDS